MSGDCLTLDEFPHFKTQWMSSSNPNIYQHLLSSDQCQLKTLSSVSMRELDCYSSREAYCFPFCPRIYKYNIQRNQMTDNQITFDIKLILEYVPHRFHQPDYQQQIMDSIKEVVSAVTYLRRRYGAFRVRRGMVGLTELGLVKVWVNEDYSCNQVQEFTSSQKEMVSDLFELFWEHRFLENCQLEDFESLKHLADHIEESSQKQRTFSSKKQALKSLQNYSSSHLLHNRSTNSKHYKQTDAQSTKSGKNITFSYSNKNLNDSQFVQRSNKKKSSIVLMEDDLQGLAKVLSMKKEFTFGVNGQELSSLKAVEPAGRHQRKMSCFRPSPHAENTSQQSGNDINIKKLTDHFSRASNSSSLHQVPTIQEVRQKVNTRPELLHYSTSSNPYSKFVNRKTTKQKSMSIFDHSEQSHHQRKDKENKRKTVGFQTNLCEFSVSEREEGQVETAQEVKNDLDALFTQDNDFDYKQLQSDLDNVL